MPVVSNATWMNKTDYLTPNRDRPLHEVIEDF